MTVVLRAAFLVSLQLAASLAFCQNAPADAGKTSADKPAAVPAPPTPSATLQDAKPARPAAAPTNGAGPKPSTDGFITAPAPVLPLPGNSPAPPTAATSPPSAVPAPVPTRSVQISSESPSTPQGNGTKPADDAGGQPSIPVDANAKPTTPGGDAAAKPPSTSPEPSAKAPALVPDSSAKPPTAAPEANPKPAPADGVPKTIEVNAVETVPSPKTAPGVDLQQQKNASSTGGLRDLRKLSRDEIVTATSDNLAIYVLRDNERTLVLDFPNIREQAKMFARLILFIERAGTSKTRIMTVPEVRKWSSDNATPIEALTVGNNMRTGELARFFNSARFQGEPITVQEQRLYDALVELQLLREEAGGVAVVEPERILVSVPQASSVAGCPVCTINAAQRAVILQHELAHARFATDTVYQNYAIWFWANALTLVQRDKLQKFLRARGYDSTIRELCANELQAFLMHTPDPRMFSAADVGMPDSELADLRQRFSEGLTPKPRAAVDKAYQFE